MKMILGLFIFWATTFGIGKFIFDKFKINKYFIIPLVFSLIGIIMFLAGILNILNLTALIISILGILYLGYSIYKTKIDKKKIVSFLKNPSHLLVIFIFIYITIIGSNMHLIHYDNFSHWGLIIKNMFLEGALPNFENSTIMFKGYQPGSACFIYYLGFLCGKTEGIMIVAQNYLIFGYLTALLNFLKENDTWIKRLLFVSFYIFIMVVSIKFNDLLVDSLIATITISALAIIYNYRTEIKKASLYSLPILIFLLLVKNTGLVLAGIACIYLLYLAFKNKQLKIGIKYMFIIAIFLLLFLVIWQNHVELVYGVNALNSKHSLTFENIIMQLRDKGWSNIFAWIIDYIKHFLTLSQNKANVLMLLINIGVLLFIFSEKDSLERKKQLKLLFSINFLYIFYYIVLGLMYILSMPWSEAVVFASYERYMTTILIIIIGIISIYLFSYDIKKIITKILMIVYSFTLVFSMYFYQDNAKVLIGNDSYKNSYAEKFDNIISKITISSSEDYYIYSPNSKGDYGYMHHLAIYKLNASKVHVLYDPNNILMINNGILIIMDQDEKIQGILSKHNWQKTKENFYIKENISVK